MAQIVLTAAANTAVKRFGLGQISSLALRTGSQFLGQAIDNAILGNNQVLSSGSRLENLAIQTSTYGEMIPIIYGISRTAGNIIWSRPIEETVTVTSQGGGKGGGSSVKTERYSYSISLAIAICEGEIDDIVRVWADADIIDPNLGEYRLYKGTETQEPDPFIESFEGIGSTPAYRGLAYVVIEDFPLADYGNRIPNFSFEVIRKMRMPDHSDAVEEQVSAMVMIPGSGEFVYDTVIQQKQLGTDIAGTWAQQGEASDVNQNNRDNSADALVSLNQLESTCPNVNWISVVVGWFGDNVDAGLCSIKPGVEFDSMNTTPDIWQVAGFDRASAYQISKDANGNPVYGGTICDVSLVRYLDELQARGYQVMFYPLFFMDTADKPWRGRVTGSVADVANFFVKTDGYNAFINHYANLVKDKVDAFIIGSELIGLTSVRDTSDDSFPAVDALVVLASQVKSVVGSSVKVSYAADWSEYHHTTGGWYHLDPLWSSADIDFIGIDAYFPISDELQDKNYDKQKLIDGWSSGEGYDWIYTDSTRTTKQTIDDRFAWKNIAWWWSNAHVNPDLNTTAWVPESKKIWFTEYGFPSVDGAANQPNVFYDPNSSESAFPYHSKGNIDFKAQRTAISATEDAWNNSSMVERMFLWTWDARPYPFWPQLRDVWSDYQLWDYGHWVQGKLSVSGLAAVIADLCQKAGLDESGYDVSKINELLDGFVLNNQTSIADIMETLQLAFFLMLLRETVSFISFHEN
ncbi:MAG: glycoside hydrolase TIM-barrel-like domain-containing protein [Rickettsiales bacterium]|nr:glycoside hydrolase TIM-barrel-like domain-containing protein [Rickettsiales bacterium]